MTKSIGVVILLFAVACSGQQACPAVALPPEYGAHGFVIPPGGRLCRAVPLVDDAPSRGQRGELTIDFANKSVEEVKAIVRSSMAASGWDPIQGAEEGRYVHGNGQAWTNAFVDVRGPLSGRPTEAYVSISTHHQ